MSTRPVTGVTPSPTEDQLPHGTFRRYAMASTYIEGVEAAGGIPVVLPPQRDTAESLLDRIDGLLFSGGGDIDPARYGDDTRHPDTYGIDELRDSFELELFRAALARDMPIFCICRGIQVANVALGGTLIQDVSDEIGTAIEHSQHKAGFKPADKGHTVDVVPGTLLHEIFGESEVGTNSFHHQAIRTPGTGLRVAATAPDGVIEAVDRPGSSFFIGVQWHPEMMFRDHPEHLKLFQALAQASAASASRTTTALASD